MSQVVRTGSYEPADAVCETDQHRGNVLGYRVGLRSSVLGSCLVAGYACSFISSGRTPKRRATSKLEQVLTLRASWSDE